MFDSKETISIANRLMDIFNQNDILFRVRASWQYFWYTVGVIEALKLFIIGTDGGDDLQTTYRLFGGYPFHQEVLEKVSFEPRFVLLITLQMNMYKKGSGF